MQMEDKAYADTFFVLDFDRCLGNTDKFHQILEQVITEETALTSEEIQTGRRLIEEVGKSFDTISFMRKSLKDRGSPISWLDIQKRFVERAKKEDVHQPHANELLAILDARQIPYGIVTYGGETWQLAKLEAAGFLSIPHIVTNIKEKGELVSGWKREDRFIIPPALTKTFQPLAVGKIVFLDDKAVSFQDMPAGVQGVHIQDPSGKVLPSQAGTLPPGVTTVAGLKGAIDLLF